MDVLDKCSSKALYQQLAGLIRRQVLNGELKPGDRLSSETQLVEQYKISRSSVRQAIDLLETEGLVTCVHGKGNYIRDWRADSTEGGVIALLVPYERLSLFPNTIRGLEKASAELGYSLLFGYMGKNDQEERGYIERLRGQKVAGLVIYPRNGVRRDEVIWQLKEEGFPFVCIDRYFRDMPCSYVGIDHAGAAASVVSYLADLGHQRIGIMLPATLDTTSMQERFQGYLAGMKKNMLSVDEGLVMRLPSESYSPVNPELNEASEIETMRRFFRREKIPSAMLAINDYTAYQFFKAAKAEGVVIPDQMSLFGFDNDEYSRLNEVPISTVEQPFSQIGEQAARLLIDTIAGNQSRIRRINCPTRMVIRDSCARIPRAAFDGGKGG